MSDIETKVDVNVEASGDVTEVSSDTAAIEKPTEGIAVKKRIKIPISCVLGILISVLFCIMGLITRATLVENGVILDLTSDGFLLFGVFVSSALGSLSAVLAVCGVVINILGVFVKTRWVSGFNAVLVALTCVWLFFLLKLL